VHDFTGGIAQSGLVWTVPLPDEAVVASHGGKRLDVSVNDVAVIDSTGAPAVDVPATVSFQMTWRATSPARRAGKGTAVAPTDPEAFLGRLASARARGTFSGTAGSFTFRSVPQPQRTIFGVLGTEQAGALLPGAVTCGACASAPVPPGPW
jgi:hypothetical protein